MNLKIKFRESFRPFAPAVLQERAARVVRPASRARRARTCSWSPRCASDRRVADRRRGSCGRWQTTPTCATGSTSSAPTIPAVTHVDYSARVQTVDEERNPRFHRLLEAFERLTGCPVLVNTSFNVRGEPIVCTPEDAYRCFLATDMDALVLEDIVIVKDDGRPRRPARRPRAVPGPVPARLSRLDAQIVRCLPQEGAGAGPVGPHAAGRPRARGADQRRQ